MVDLRLNSFLALPALFILVPPFLEDTNALSGILSSRINSKLHIGAIDPTPIPQTLAWIDIAINFVFAASVFFMVGLSAHLVAVGTGQASPGLGTMLSISMLAGFLATIISCAVAYYSAIAAFRFGLDPDNFSIPIILRGDGPRWHPVPRTGYPAARRDRSWMNNPRTSKSSSSS